MPRLRRRTAPSTFTPAGPVTLTALGLLSDASTSYSTASSCARVIQTKKNDDTSQSNEHSPRDISPSRASHRHPRTSLSDRNPSALSAVWCTKISSVPSSGMMNPNPLTALNHFTYDDVNTSIHPSSVSRRSHRNLSSTRAFLIRVVSSLTRPRARASFHFSKSADAREPRSIRRAKPHGAFPVLLESPARAPTERASRRNPRRRRPPPHHSSASTDARLRDISAWRH